MFVGEVRKSRDLRWQLEQYGQHGRLDVELEQSLADFECQQQCWVSLDVLLKRVGLYDPIQKHCVNHKVYFLNKDMQHLSFLVGNSNQENEAYKKAKDGWGLYVPAIYQYFKLSPTQRDYHWNRFINLFDLSNVIKAEKKARRGKRSRNDVGDFNKDLIANVKNIISTIFEGKYRFGPYLEFEKTDSRKRRKISATAYPDRIVHWVMYEYLYDIFSNKFIYDSYGNIKNKGSIRAVNRVQSFTRKKDVTHILKIDLSKYFFSVMHEKLLQLFSQYIDNVFVMSLIESILCSYVTDDSYDHLFESDSYYRKNYTKGMPIGLLISQLSANVYLNTFDHYIKDEIGFKYYARYVDDMVFLGSLEELKSIHEKVIKFLSFDLNLTIHPKKISFTKLSLDNPFLFLGYRISKYKINPSKEIDKKVKRASSINDFKTIQDLNGVTKWCSWKGGCFKHYQSRRESNF